MTKDELKKLLHSYTDMKREQDQICAELDRIETEGDGLRGLTLDGMPRSGSGPGDPTGGLATQRLTLQERYRAQLQHLMRAQAAIEALIEPLDSRARTLLRHRYIEGLTWEQVCVAMCYSWRQTHNIHAQALEQMLELSRAAGE